MLSLEEKFFTGQEVRAEFKWNMSHLEAKIDNILEILNVRTIHRSPLHDTVSQLGH